MKTDFEWPKALRAVRAAAEDGALETRDLYPLEVQALCSLTAGAPLDESPRVVAPGMTVAAKTEQRGGGYSQESRTAYFYICRFKNGRLWQCSLFTDWHPTAVPGRELKALRELAPRNIMRALTRAITPQVPKIRINDSGVRK